MLYVKWHGFDTSARPHSDAVASCRGNGEWSGTARFSCLLCCVLQAHGLFAGSVTVSLANSKHACRVISLPKWKAPELPPDTYEWSVFLHSSPGLADWDFREGNVEILVGVFAVPEHPPDYPKPWPRFYSPTKYAIGLSTGRIRKATEGEWVTAKPLHALRQSPLRAGQVMKKKDRLVYQGREFRKRGTEWPSLSEEVGRLSQGGAVLAVNSWDGQINIGGGGMEYLFGWDTSDGNYYVEVYETDSGRLVLALIGHFHHTEPDPLFRSAGWISNRYYMFPLDQLRMNRFVFCDVGKAAGPNLERAR